MSLTFPEYESFDALGLANLIQRGVLSPEEMLNAAIERVELHNPKLNAIITKFYDRAHDAIKKGLPSGPFYGVPLVLKDLSDYKDTPIYYGSRYAYNHHKISPISSEVVNRMEKAGLVIFGKTNVPEFGLSPLTEPKLFGPTHNPWNLEYSPGGSSGGSAAVVAARILPMAHGGDGGGSLRIPAAYTGIFGFKPSRGRNPSGPAITRLWLGMVVEHILTRSVRDSAAMLDVLAGPELGSPISLPKPSTSYLDQLKKPVRSLRIGLIDQPFFKATVHQEYFSYLNQAAKLCESLGHHVEPIKIPLPRDLAQAFLTIMIGESHFIMKQLMASVGKHPKSNEFEKGTAVLFHAGEEFTAASFARAIHIIDRTEQTLASIFNNYDVLLTLTMPFPAPKIGEYQPTLMEQTVIGLLQHLPYGQTLHRFLSRASERDFAFMAFTALFNMCGQPAMSVPLYWDKQNMPVGIQFAAEWQNDGLLLQLAHQLEEAQPWEHKNPNLKNNLSALLTSWKPMKTKFPERKVLPADDIGF